MSFVLCVLSQYDLLHFAVFPRVIQSPSTRTCIQGGQCSLSCITEGVPSPAIEWFQNGGKVNPGGVISLVNSSSYTEGNSTLMITNVMLKHAGSYHCNASNTLVTSSSIVSQLADITVHCESKNAQLSILGSIIFYP